MEYRPSNRGLFRATPTMPESAVKNVNSPAPPNAHTNLRRAQAKHRQLQENAGRRRSCGVPDRAALCRAEGQAGPEQLCCRGWRLVRVPHVHVHLDTEAEHRQPHQGHEEVHHVQPELRTPQSQAQLHESASESVARLTLKNPTQKPVDLRSSMMAALHAQLP